MRRKVLIAMLAISVVFVVIGAAMIATGDSGGWMSVLFFGVCGAVGIVELRPTLLQSEKRSVETLAALYPGPLVLRASRKRATFLFLTSLAFAAAIAWTLFTEDVGLVGHVAFWPGLVLFGLGAVVSAVLVVKGATLRLDGEGMTVSQFWRRWFLSWRDLGPFEVFAVPPAGTRMVVYDYAPADATRLGRANRALAGRNSALSDSYGLGFEDLAALLNAWRAAALFGGEGDGPA